MRLVIDITTLIDSELPHGISRLIGEVTRALAITPATELVLVRYLSRRQGFEVVALDISHALAIRDRQSAGHGPEFLTPAGFGVSRVAADRRLITRVYYILPVRLRMAALRALNAVADFAWELVVTLFRRPNPLKAIHGRVIGRYEPRIGDTFLQAGALWMHRGIEQSLAELRMAGVRIVSLLYDVIPLLYPHFFEEKFGLRFTSWFLATLAESSLVVTISDTTLRDVESEARRRRVVCPPLVRLRLGDDSFTAPDEPASPPLKRLEERDFALCLGTLEVRKNTYLLYRVWRRMIEAGVTPPRLVLAGKRGWLADDAYQLLTHDPLLHDHVYIIHGANDVDVAWLLSRATLVLYPSFYEGWGLPVAEGLAAGRAVLASTSPAVVEAAQGLAVHLDADDVAGWQKAILSLAEDAIARGAIEARVRREYRPTRWQDTAAGLGELLNNIPAAEVRAVAAKS